MESKTVICDPGTGYMKMGYAGDNFPKATFASLVGSLLYSVESIGIVFTVRSTLKQPRKMSFILTVTFTLITFLFIVNGLSFVSVG